MTGEEEYRYFIQEWDNKLSTILAENKSVTGEQVSKLWKEHVFSWKTLKENEKKNVSFSRYNVHIK